MKNTEKKTKKEGYWASHRLVVGSLGETMNRHDGSLPSIDLGPKFTVSGDFDCGLVEHVQVGYEPDFFRQPIKAPAMTANAMLLLVEKDSSWQIASERAEFMPGDHSPCCEIDKASESKIGDTLKSIWKLRERRVFNSCSCRRSAQGEDDHICGQWQRICYQCYLGVFGGCGGHEADVYRDGDSFRIVYANSAVAGTISGDEVSGKWITSSGREGKFKGTLKSQSK